MSEENTAKLSLPGSIALGTGVMIGAGIFALVGQVAGIAGDLMPLAFLAAAVVVAFSAYSYAKYGSANPSSGGIAMQLKDAYGPGVIAGTFSLFMYVSMVIAESLLGRTFGTYLLRPFGLEDSAVLVPALGVAAIAAATIVNIVGNRAVERSATVTAVLKIVGIAVLAVGGLVTAGFSSVTRIASGDYEPPDQGWLGFLAAVTLCVLAYKGFTTITNQGADMERAESTLPRSIAISIALCTVLYLLIAVSIASSLSPSEIADARDYALAAAAEPLFGGVGVGLTIAIAIIATLSGLLASLFSVSRLHQMLTSMGQAPTLPKSVPHRSLLLTAGLAIAITALFDLSQIASMGAVLYLAMDIVVHWGVIRHQRRSLNAKPWIPTVAIVLDVAILSAFVVVKAEQDALPLIVAAAIAVVIAFGQVWVLRRRKASEER